MPDQSWDPSAVIDLRRRLAATAELADEEHRTAAVVADFLADCRPERLVTQVGGTGVLAVFAGLDEGPTVILRAELDALAIPDGDRAASHRCGHDGHMAILAGLASVLREVRPDIGRVALLFQPAEETGGGAARVLAEPAVSGLEPSLAFALHNLPGFEAGAVVVRPGAMAAASVGLQVELIGRSAHAGEPARGLSPTPLLAALLADLGSGPPPGAGEPGALATVVGARLGRGSFGTLPGHAVLQLTLRAFEDEALVRLVSAVRGRIESVAAGSGLALRFHQVEPFPAVHNDDEGTGHVWAAARGLGLTVQTPMRPFSWSEDFGHFARLCPSVLFGLGVGEQVPPLHDPGYEFPDAVLPVGVAVFTALVHHVLGWEAGLQHVSRLPRVSS